MRFLVNLMPGTGHYLVELEDLGDGVMYKTTEEVGVQVSLTREELESLARECLSALGGQISLRQAQNAEPDRPNSFLTRFRKGKLRE